MKVKLTGLTLTVECPEVELALDKILGKLDIIIKEEKRIMGKLEDTLAKIGELGIQMETLNTEFDGFRADVQALKDQLAALQSGEVLSDVVAAKVQAISDAVDDLGGKIQVVQDENFPPVTPPPDEV